MRLMRAQQVQPCVCHPLFKALLPSFRRVFACFSCKRRKPLPFHARFALLRIIAVRNDSCALEPYLPTSPTLSLEGPSSESQILFVLIRNSKYKYSIYDSCSNLRYYIFQRFSRLHLKRPGSEWRELAVEREKWRKHNQRAKLPQKEKTVKLCV